jgi:3-hydroxyisobutyrate dehydrogenase
METIVVLGTGIMGTGMARSLRRAGYEVIVWNRTRARGEAVGDGTKVAGSPREAVAGAAFVLTMLSDGPAVHEIAREFLPAFHGVAWLQSSTVGPAATRQLAALSAEHGTQYVECPVLGSKEAAERGQLTVLAAGPAALERRVEPVLAAVGSTTRWLGTDPVRASATKLVLNSWVTGLVALLAETLVFAESQGIAPDLFLGAIKGGALDVPYAQLKGGLMVRREYPTSFPLSLAGKDVRLVIDAAARAGLDLAVLGAMAKLYERAAVEGHGAADLSAVAEALRGAPSESSTTG